MTNSVFVSYRKRDDPFGALYIDNGLAERFGRDEVFLDHCSIPLGTPFPARIAEALWRCRALVAIIGRNWFGVLPDGRRLIDDPTDYVRYETGVAIQRGIPVIPVLVQDAPLPPANALPADIAELSNRQYLRLRVRGAADALAHLVDELVGVLGTGGLRVPAGAESPPALHRGLAGATVRHDLHGPVDARYAVFGNVNITR